MTLSPRQVRKYTHFPRSGSALGALNVKEATLDIENQTWFVMFDGQVKRKEAREAMKHFLDQGRYVPYRDRKPQMVHVLIRCDEVSVIRSNPGGMVTIAKGHLSFDGVLKNPTSVSEFKAEMHGMVIDKPEKHFTKHRYNKLDDKAFLDKLWSFVSFTGESYGWVTKNGTIYHRRASLIMPKIKINKRPGDEVAFYHTHPSKDEPSLTSADDIQWYLDASFSTGVKRHYTIMRDRIDRFTFKVKNNRVEKYLGFDEEKFIADIDAMLEAGEAEAKKDKGIDDVEFCRIITQHMVDLFNKKYGSIATISYKQFVNPNYTPPKEVPKGDEDPFEVRANPGPVSSKIRPPSRLYHTALEELSGLDYDYVHYGGDEYAHTMFCYFWLSHHLEPTKQFPSGRMFKWEDIGFDSDLRKKVRAYLNENIASNYSMLDLVYILALYHDAGKNIQKDSGNEIHHSKGAQMMWDSFIADELDIPEPLDDIVSVMLESDIGRRNISEDFFRTQVGPYYGAALFMLMADIATHHPFMWTGMAQEFKSAGHYDGKVNGADFKNWYLRQHVEKLRTFLNEPRQNPRPLVASVKYRWNYGVQDISAALMEAAFEPYLRHNVDPSKEYWYPTNKTSGNGYLILNTTNAPELGDFIPDGYDLNVRASNGTGNFDLTFRKDFPNLNMNLGREAVNAVYLTLGRALQDIEDIELEDPEQAAVPVVAVNPRKASRVRLISISGPAGVGKSTSIRLLKKKFPGVGEVLAYTTRPPRPKERDGVDKHFVSKAKFMEMIQNDEFLEYRRMKNGHLYGRRFADFKYPINVIDVNIGGMKKYKELFPDMFSIYLRPKNRSTSALEAMLLERGGMSKKEAKERALLMPAQIARASKEDFDLFIDMETGNYRKNFLSRIDEIPLENPAVPVGEVMQEVPERLPRQATFGQGLAPETDAERNYRDLRRRIISFNNMAESGEYSAFAIPSYFDDSYLPEGTIRSPVENRTHVLVPNAQAERFSALLDSSALPMGNPPKELFEWFEEWVHLINMKNKELKAFLDSPLGKKAGLSKEEADAQGIKSGRVSGRRILKMRAKLGLTGPKDYIKIGPRIIENYYEKALKEWTGPSDDPLDGETDWDWCKRQVRFVKRHGAFPYNADQKGPLVREQKTQNQVSRRLLGLWVWGHDPWRWARKHDISRMPPCPDVPWIGMTEKRKYGKVEVKMNPWFPSDVSYPSALTAQTISITQLSNLPRPNPRTPGGRKIPSKYLKGLTPVEKAIAEYEIDRGYKYDVDDPKAYEFWKSDIKATARGMETTPSKYRAKFARLYGPLKGKGSFLTRMSKTTGVDKAILEKVYDKGLAAWRTGHRPGVQQHQWAAGRVYSFVTLGNTVMKDGKKMGDYSLAVEAGLIKENSSRHDWVEEDEDEFLNMFEW